MVEEQTVRYRGESCKHINEITFVGSVEPWETKTVGCQQCGKTQLFVREQELENEDTDMIEHHDDSDLRPNEDDGEQNGVATEDTVVDDEGMDEQEGEQAGVETTAIDENDGLEDLSYRELQSVAVETDVRGNQKQDVLVQDLRECSEDVQSIITEVVGDNSE